MRLFLLALVASATVPMSTYPDCGPPYGADVCPSDLGEEWWEISTIPVGSQETVRPAELALGSGAWADQAFRTQVGRWDAIVAITDSGIEWGASDLIYKVHLNTGELPFPEGFDTYDADGNGLVNVADYAGDSRVSVDAGVDSADGKLDPSDLIYSFSDGLDGDGNGYTDDIAGWDFFADDNDPYTTYDEGHGTHGTGTMTDAVAEGNGGGGTIGLCPNCALLPLRVSDTFITDGSRQALGVAYAVDMGAKVVGQAIGALSHPMLAEQAYAYAYANDVVIVAAAGDENAYHHNLPAMSHETLYVHSIRFDTIDEGGSYSFMNFFNCNNYGPRVDAVAASPACATGSVAVISGLSGLIWSAVMDAGLTLHVEQMRQLVMVNVDDIHLSPDEVKTAKTYPSSEGWDPFFGAGRVNAYKAVTAVQEGRIPPVAAIDGPEWFTVLYPDRTPSLDLGVRAEGSWTLEVGRGWEPTTWDSLGSGSGDGSVTVDVSGFDTAPVPGPEREEGVLDRVERTHAPAVTFRLTVKGENGVDSVARRTLYVHSDPELKPGFPVALGGSGESSPILADLDGDQVLEIVSATASGQVHAFLGDGTELQGWPVSTNPDPTAQNHLASAAFASGALDPDHADGILGTAAVADLDGDGSPEVVAATIHGFVYAWTAGGERVPGFPVEIIGREPAEFDGDRAWANSIGSAPTLVDIDGDGTREIIVMAMDGRLYIWDSTGALVDEWEVCHPENCGSKGFKAIASPSVADVDGDGDLDAVVGTNESVNDGAQSVTHAFDLQTGTPLTGWPHVGTGLVAEAALLPIVGEGHPASVGLVDVDGDGKSEVVDAIMLGQTDILGPDAEVKVDLSYVSDTYGEKSNSDEPSFVSLSNQPAVGDLDLDGTPDVIMGGAGTYAVVGLALTTAIDFQHVLGAWSGRTGTFLEGWPRQVEDFQFLLAPAVADVSGDGYPEVMYGSAGYMLHAWDAWGREPEGWPKFTGQWLMGSPAVGDIDGDGYVDVVVTTREGFLYAWTTQGRADQPIQWASIHHDPANTGNYHTPLMAQPGPPAAGGCCSDDGADSAALVLLLPGLIIARRRRPLSR